MSKRKKNQSITETIAQHLETPEQETVIIPEVAGVPEEKFESVFEKEEIESVPEVKAEELKEEAPKVKIVDGKTKEVVKKEPKKHAPKPTQVPKKKINQALSPHHKDSATSGINFSIGSIL